MRAHIDLTMPKKNRSSPYLLLVLGLIILLGSVLRFHDLGKKSLWTDETASIRDSESMMSALKGSQPPLYYLVLYLFRSLGTNEFIVRLPSAIFGVLTIALSYWIGKLFFGTEEGLITALLLSISPFHIYYSQEARMYTLLTFLSLLSLFFFYRSASERKKSLWAGFILSTLLALYTHYFGFFVLFVEATIFILATAISKFSIMAKSRKTYGRMRVQKRSPMLFILSMTIILILVAPFLYWRAPARFLRFLPAGSSGASGSTTYTPLQVTFIVKILGEFSGGSPFSYGSQVLYLYLFFFLCGCVLSIKNHAEKLALMLLWIVLPIPLLFLASTRVTVYAEPRYLIHVLPVYLLVASKGITSVPKYLLSFPQVRTGIKSLFPFFSVRSPRNRMRALHIAIFIIAAIFLGSSITPLLGYYEREKRDWKAVIAYLEAESQPDDVIIVDPSHLMEPFSYYFNNPKNVTVRRTHGDVPTLEKLYHRYSRVWFVTYQSEKRTQIINWLSQHALWQKTFDGGLCVYMISQLPPAQHRAVIFSNLVTSQSCISWWRTTLASAGVSTTVFDDAMRISTVNISEFDLVVFIDVKRPLDDGERHYLQGNIDNGLIVMVSGLSPYWLAGGNTDLASISTWFGATMFSEAPSKDRLETRFTTQAVKIVEDLEISKGYAFYTESDWSTPTAVIAESESVVYAYRDDGKAALFIHDFGKGTVIFNGVRYGFWSRDANVYQPILSNLVLSIMHAQ